MNQATFIINNTAGVRYQQWPEVSTFFRDRTCLSTPALIIIKNEKNVRSTRIYGGGNGKDFRF